MLSFFSVNGIKKKDRAAAAAVAAAFTLLFCLFENGVRFAADPLFWRFAVSVLPFFGAVGAAFTLERLPWLSPLAAAAGAGLGVWLLPEVWPLWCFALLPAALAVSLLRAEGAGRLFRPLSAALSAAELAAAVAAAVAAFRDPYVFGFLKPSSNRDAWGFWATAALFLLFACRAVLGFRRLPAKGNVKQAGKKKKSPQTRTTRGFFILFLCLPVVLCFVLSALAAVTLWIKGAGTGVPCQLPRCLAAFFVTAAFFARQP